MKRFHFPLEKVLRYRQLLVEAEEAKLEAAVARVLEIDRGVAELDTESTGTADKVRATLAAAGQIEPSHLAFYPDYRFLLARNRQSLIDARQRAEADVERQRAALVEARRAHEILMRARTLAKERWQADFLKEQEAVAGELFLSSWGRRRSSSRLPG